MKTINTNTQENIRFTLFPDNQPHVDVTGIQTGDEVKVIAPLRSANDIIHLLQISDALDGIGAIKSELEIPYLIGARYDRSMRFGDSRDLKIFANLINSCKFPKVGIFDAHSDVALALIDNSKNITNELLVKAYDKDNAILICPDAGAMKKVDKYSQWNPDIKDVKYCIKHRDLDTGHVQLKLLDEHNDCQGRNVVVIDDICDGGATFLAIASQVYYPKSLTLIVSHGIFSKGLRQLKEKFTEIITTDSFQYQNPTPQLKVLNLYGR